MTINWDQLANDGMSVLIWFGLAILALMVAAGVSWVFGQFVDVGAASINRPRTTRHRRDVPRKLARDLAETNKLTDEQLEYELTTFPRSRAPGFGVESQTLPVYEALEIAGIPRWQVRQLLNLTGKDLNTRADIERWQRICDKVAERVQRVAKLINAKRETLIITGVDDFVPEFIRAEADPSPFPPAA